MLEHALTGPGSLGESAQTQAATIAAPCFDWPEDTESQVFMVLGKRAPDGTFSLQLSNGTVRSTAVSSLLQSMG